MNKKLIIFILIGISLISVLLNLYKKDLSPPCFNADEAAFGYNAYSIFKTGKDEYGTTLPLRLKSFGDYKMPLYSYLSAPIVGLFGLNENSARLLNTFIAFIFPFAIFLLVNELFKNHNISLLAAFFASVALGLQIVGRHAHEAYLASFLVILTAYFLLKTINKFNLKNTLLLSFTAFLALMSYQSSRIFAVYFVLIFIFYYAAKKIKKKSVFIVFLSVLGLFVLTDIIYKPARVSNLLIFNNGGFQLKLQELKTEGGIKLLNTQIINGSRDIVLKYFEYLSPQFLIQNGDANPRFGYLGLSLITPIEYIFIFVGLYFLFKNKEKWRYFLLGLFLISPLTGSLAWTDLSLTRSFFILIPAFILASYGIIILLKSTKINYRLPILLIIFFGYFIFLSYNWNFYLYHYPKRALAIRAWQCGYAKLAEYVKKSYDKFDKFYITRKHGQPYVFLLFYSKYSPSIYQKLAKLSQPDEYGFGQVEAFDKFIFSFQKPEKDKKYVAIGYPDDFLDIANNEEAKSKIKKIYAQNQEIFWIYEQP